MPTLLELDEFYNAAITGDLALITSLHQKGMLLDAKLCKFAKTARSMNILEYAYAQGVDWGAEPRVAEFDDWDALGSSGREWLGENGRTLGDPWHERTVARAAIEGRLDVLKFLNNKHEYLNRSGQKHRNGLMKLALVSAAAGHLDIYEQSMNTTHSTIPAPVSEWLTGNGGHISGGWDTGTFARAVSGGRCDVVEFLYNAGCEIDEDLSTPDYETACFLKDANIPRKPIIPPMPECECELRCPGVCEGWTLYEFDWLN